MCSNPVSKRSVIQPVFNRFHCGLPANPPRYRLESNKDMSEKLACKRLSTSLIIIFFALNPMMIVVFPKNFSRHHLAVVNPLSQMGGGHLKEERPMALYVAPLKNHLPKCETPYVVHSTRLCTVQHGMSEFDPPLGVRIKLCLLAH